MNNFSLFTATTPEEAKDIYKEIKDEFGSQCEIQFGILEKIPPKTVECLIFIDRYRVQFHGTPEALFELQDIVVEDKIKKVKWS